MEPIQTPPRAATSEPASLPSHASMSKPDSSPSRKRARLDSGPITIRGTSEDPISPVLKHNELHASSSTTPASPTQHNASQPDPILTPPTPQASRVTINVRTHPMPSSAEDACHTAPEPVSQISENATSSTSPTSTPSSDVEPTVDLPNKQKTVPKKLPLSPMDSPVMELEVEAMDEDSEPTVVEIDDNDDSDPTIFFEGFPFSDDISGILDLIKMVAHHIGSESFDSSTLSKLAEWLGGLMAYRPHTIILEHRQNQQAWDYLARITVTLSNRTSVPVMRANNTDILRDRIADYMSSYMLLYSYLLQVDTDNVRQWQSSYPLQKQQYLYIARHTRTLAVFFQPDSQSPLLQTLLNLADPIRVSAMRTKIACNFAKGPTDGLRSLCQFITTAHGRIPGQIMVGCLQILNGVISAVANSQSCFNADEAAIVRIETLELFQALDKELQEVGRILPIELNRDLVNAGAEFLSTALESLLRPAVFPASKNLCADITGELATHYEESWLASIVAQTWKLKLLNKYITKGKMELRVACVLDMDNSLVHLYKSCDNGQHPVLQYVAGLLLQLKIVDYIVGVDSHPQLIQRSANIVGFLVVTRRYTENETDKLWRTIVSSQDPRVVSAMVHMLGIIIGLMQPQQALYMLVEKFGALPIQSMSHEMLSIFRNLCSKLAPNQQADDDAIDWAEVDPQRNPYRICFHMIRETSPYAQPSHRRQSVSKEAAMQLRAFSATLPITERAKILDSSVQRIRNQDEDALADIHAIQAVAGLSFAEDAKLLTKDLELARHLVPEICAFVKREHSKPPVQTQYAALNSRLELLVYIIQRDPLSISDDILEPLWNSILGRDALNNRLRDLAWRKFFELSKFQSGNIFLRKLLEDFVPTLDPIFFTDGFYDFVTHVTDLAWRKFTTEWRPGAPIDIPYASLLWRIILTAPKDTIEERTSKVLAFRYTDILRAPSVTLEAVENAHLALAKQCLERLSPAFAAIRDKEESMVVDSPQPHTDLHTHELSFTRTLLFMGIIVSIIRHKPDFCPPPTPSLKRPITPDLPITGDPMTIQFQAFNGQESPIQRLVIGEDDTLRSLKERLSQATGFSSFRVIARGNDLDLESQALKTVKEIQGVNWLLIRSQPDADQSRSSHVSSKFEQEIMSHFEDLYQYMDRDDRVSEATACFLNLFPAVESVVTLTTEGDNDGAQIFPHGKPFAARYNCRALGSRLQSQLKQNVVDTNFLKASIKLLSQTLVKNPLIDQTLEQIGASPTVALFLETLQWFMKERPFNEDAVDYFDDEAAFVARLVGLMKSAARLPSERWLVVWCFNILLEGSLHSVKVWTCFTGREDVTAIFSAIFLEDTCVPLRNESKKTIEATCDVRDECKKTIEAMCNQSSSPQPVSASQFVEFFWLVLSRVVLTSHEYPKRCGQLFGVVEFVFRKHNEQSRNEAELRTLFAKWSEHLLSYEHKEIVGRFEVDHFVAGYTKLLSACAQSLKSFKKPLGAHDLIEQLFVKFLFVRADSDEAVVSNKLPVMDTATRRDLYDLILSFCEDVDACEQIYTHLLPITIDKEAVVEGRGYMVDRDDEIRSGTGYVGVYNPRNICYMNSLMTQLFMNREFRRFMLNMDVTESVGSQRLLAETQKLFARLQNSYAKAADPRGFAACIRGIDGEPIDITIQMDADEFYNLLFDQWEQQMLSNMSKQQFRSFYGGKTVTQIKSHECEHVSEREESFFVVQCDVKGKPNILDSLQSYVQGDVMEGDNKYKCESCGGKFVDAVKRTCLKEVPDNLILHLKRFDFDLTHMTRAKIDDHFEFPDKLDVSPYNVNHLSSPDTPRTPDVFELVGVLIHQGTAEGGHYYSLIRERPSGSAGAPKWLEFNDRDVTDLQAQMIQAVAFGGPADDTYAQNQTGPRSKQYSAYMLFYQRTSTIISEQNALQISADGPQRVPIPQALEEEIARDNEIVVRTHGAFDPNHARFVRQLYSHQRNVLCKGVCTEDHETEKAALFVTVQYVRQVVARNRDLLEFDEIGNLLRDSISGCVICCYHMLEALNYMNTLNDLLFKCPYPRVRTKTRLLLIEGLNILRAENSDHYGLRFSDGYLHEDGDSIAPKTIQRLIGIMRTQLTTSTRGWDDLFHTILDICSGEDRFAERGLLLHEQVLTWGLELLAGSVIRKVQQRWEGIGMILEKKRGIYNKLIELVFELLTAVDLKIEPIRDFRDRDIESYDSTTLLYPLTRAESQLLNHYNDDDSVLTVLGKALDLWDKSKERSLADFVPGKLLAMYVEANPPFCNLDMLHNSIVVNVVDLNWSFSEPYIRAALWYCRSCPESRYITDLLTRVANSVHAQQTCVGPAYVTFFDDLLELQNERLYGHVDQDFFYKSILTVITRLSTGFLLQDDDLTRKKAVTLINTVFTSSLAERSRTSNTWRFRVLRELIKALVQKLATETRNGASRAVMSEFQQALTDCLETLSNLIDSEDPAAQEFKDPDDQNMLLQWHDRIDQILAVWPIEDDDAFISGNEPFENSDYVSDSDFEHDLP